MVNPDQKPLSKAPLLLWAAGCPGNTENLPLASVLIQDLQWCRLMGPHDGSSSCSCSPALLTHIQGRAHLPVCDMRRTEKMVKLWECCLVTKMNQLPADKKKSGMSSSSSVTSGRNASITPLFSVSKGQSPLSTWNIQNPPKYNLCLFP